MNLVEIIVAASYSISAVAAFIVSTYFFLEYKSKKLRTSLAWSLSTLLFGLLTIQYFFTALWGEEIVAGSAGLIFGMIGISFTMTLFYYGTSLLFFGRDSFWRGKMSVLIFLIYIVCSAYLIATTPVTEFRERAVPFIESFLMAPVFFVMMALFYNVSRRFSRSDPRKQPTLFVAAGWLCNLLLSVYRGGFLGSLEVEDAFFVFVQGLGWIFILYGMVIGKASR